MGRGGERDAFLKEKVNLTARGRRKKTHTERGVVGGSWCVRLIFGCS